MNDNYLSHSNTDCLKGICAIMVVLGHVCSRTGLGAVLGLGPIYTAFGYWGVSGFMFVSGYGLVCSLRKNADGWGYLSTFLRNRVFPVYMLMAILVVVYYALKLLLSPNPPAIGELIQSFFFGSTVISFGWYLQSIVLIYLIFYVAAKVVLKQFNKPFGWPLCMAIGLGLLLYIGLSLFMGLDSTWYETTLCFLAGIAVASYKSQVDKMLSKEKNTIIVLIVCTTLFVVSFVIGCGPFVQGAFKIACKMMSSVLFCLCWVAFMRLVSLENSVTCFLGKLYLEIYIIQGAVYLLLRNKYWAVESPRCYFIIAIVSIVLCAWFLKPFTSLLMMKLKKERTV